LQRFDDRGQLKYSGELAISSAYGIFAEHRPQPRIWNHHSYRFASQRTLNAALAAVMDFLLLLLAASIFASVALPLVIGHRRAKYRKGDFSIVPARNLVPPENSFPGLRRTEDQNTEHTTTSETPRVALKPIPGASDKKIVWVDDHEVFAKLSCEILELPRLPCGAD